jgi:tetratricopeptide (TPR) repeat protein
LAQSRTRTSIPSKIDNANKKVIESPEEAFNLAAEALSESKKIKDRKSEASACNTLGTLHYNTGEYSKAIEYFTKAKNIYKDVNDVKSQEYTLKYLAKSFEALDQNEKSIGYYKQAEDISNSSSSKNDYRYNNSKIKRKQGKKGEAIEDLEKELKTNKTLDPKQKIDIYLELGDLYLEENNKEKGVDLINKAIESSFADSITSNDSTTISTINNAWQIYDKNGMSQLNLQSQNKILEKAVLDNSIDISGNASYNIGNSYLELNPKKASSYFNYTYEVTKDKPKEKDHIKAVEKLSEAYEKSGEYAKALEKYKEYVLLVDSLKEAELTSRLTSESLKDKYQIQESKIAELELKQAQKEESLRVQQNTIIGLIFGIVAFLLLTYFLVKNIRQKQRSNTLIQLASLRSQMNPHFIFNSLNSVNGFISKNEEIKANRYISAFSKLMRTVLNNSNNPTIPLSEELKSLEIYLSLEHSRFEDKFDYEIAIDPEINASEITVPPML